jgi:hypothetical protein
MIPYGDSMGDLSPCVPAPNPGQSVPDREYDVGRYIDLFTRPAAQGGVKDDPANVVLFALDAPETPFITLLSNPGTASGNAYVPCAPLNDTSNPACTPVLQHSCINPGNSAFDGDPAVRLNAVVNAAAAHAVSSICADDYSTALTTAARLIVSRLGLGCVTASLPRDASGNLITDCTVEDVASNLDGSTTTTNIPQCTGTNFPCWRIEPKDQCGCPAGASPCTPLSPDGLGMTIDRNGQPAPPNTTAQASCAI